MDDLNARLGQILSDPQSMAQLQSMAAALGLGQNSTTVNNTQNPPQNQAPASSTGGLDLNSLAALLGGLGASAQTAPPPPSPAPTGGLGSLGTLGLLGGLLGSRQGAEDKNVQLLRALRPHMSPARQSRVDDAIRLIQLLGLLPALRDSGLLGGLLGGDRR
ncbi:MAG TPA: hypothetical protein H9680_01710 [Firmicutes bacterium]|nr:hypothetical protein [Bacillota bacterium]